MSEFIPNSFQIPNILVDKYMGILTPVEFKCLVLIIRKTRGWHKEADAIAISQFQKYTGLSRVKSLHQALRSLEDRGLIRVSRDLGKMNIYRLSALFDSGEVVDKPGDKPGYKNATSGTFDPGPGYKTATTTRVQNRHSTKDNIKTITKENADKSATEKKEPLQLLPRYDSQLVRWAEDHGFSRARPGESFQQYRTRLISEIRSREYSNAM